VNPLFLWERVASRGEGFLSAETEPSSVEHLAMRAALDKVD
jgi:hypothetical protein